VVRRKDGTSYRLRGTVTRADPFSWAVGPFRAPGVHDESVVEEGSPASGKAQTARFEVAAN